MFATISKMRSTLPQQTPLPMRLLYSLALVSLSIAANAQVPSYVPTNGLIGWWPFSGNANDASGNGNHGVTNNASLTVDRFGNSNSAYSFNGVDQLIAGNINAISNTASTTVTAWMRYVGDAGGQPYDTYFQLGTYGSHTFAYAYEYGSQAFNLYSFCTYIPTVPLGNLNNAWHFVAIVDSETESFLYVDGNLLASGSGGPAGNCFQGSSAFSIGSANSVTDNQWVTGDLDDIGFWTRALTATEIDALYSAALVPPCVSTEVLTMTGLDASYQTTDGPATLTGTPPNGVFLGPGVSGVSFDPAAAGVGTHTIIYTYVDENGCVNSTGQCTSVSLGIGIGDEDNMPLQGVRVFPNPANGLFNLELELQGMVSLVVFDSRGRQVMNQTFMANGSKTLRVLDLSREAAGTYSLQVSTANGSVSQSLVRE